MFILIIFLLLLIVCCVYDKYTQESFDDQMEKDNKELNNKFEIRKQ